MTPDTALEGTTRYRSLNQLIGGEYIKGTSGQGTNVTDPTTGEKIAFFPNAGERELDLALAATGRGFHIWRHYSAFERCTILRRAADNIRAKSSRLALLLTMEQGKLIKEAEGEIEAAAQIFDWYAEEGRRAYGRIVPSRSEASLSMVIREPIGPVAAFTPWNFPALTPARKIAAALGAGCSIIIKPSEETPAVCLELAECCLEAGVPPEAIAVILGDAIECSSYLIRSPIIGKVSFTGSTAGGMAVAKLAAEGVKRLTLELGGHAPVLVFDDVDVKALARESAAKKFQNAGQICVSPTRFYIHEKIYDEFTSYFTEAANSINMDPTSSMPFGMGPLANKRRIESCVKLVKDARQKGATLLAGGYPVDREGYYFAPTVLGNVPDDAQIMTEEPFGPIAPLSSFESEEEVLAKANALPVGLAAYAFTESSSRAHRVSLALEAGMIGMNRYGVSAAELPFGGVKASGYGSEGGTEGLEPYLTVKLINRS